MPPFSSFTVAQLVEQAVQGQLDIPEFQREFVWRPDQVSSLVDSLHRDYPIGQILLWARPEAEGGAPAAPAATEKRWLVDGQQRTTALCLVFGQKPAWWVNAASWERRLASTDVLANLCTGPAGLQFGLANPIRTADPKWVSVRQVLQLGLPATDSAAAQRLDELAEATARKLPGKLATRFSKEVLRGRLHALLDIAGRPVAVAEVRHETEDVAEIFTRLNQQGTAVTETDVSLAVAATEHEGWVRDDFLPFLRNLADSGFDLEPGVVLRVLTAGGDGRIRLGEVPREFWASEGFPDAWARTKESLSAVVSGLASAGILSSDLLPSQNALIPLALLHWKQGTRGFLLPRALHWFLMAARDGRYSGSSTATLSEDVHDIREATDFSEAIQSLRGNLEVEFRLAPEEFLERGAWNRPLLLILYLTLFHRQATDWLSHRRLGFGRTEGTVEYGFAPYWHSFFPRSRSVLRSPEYDYTEDEIGAVANAVALSERPKDRRWTTSPPTKYVAASKVTEDQLQQQLLPTDRSLWEPDRYRDFLTSRARLLAEACNDYLASIVGSAR